MGSVIEEKPKENLTERISFLKENIGFPIILMAFFVEKIIILEDHELKKEFNSK